jgi:hypothetical protein
MLFFVFVGCGTAISFSSQRYVPFAEGATADLVTLEGHLQNAITINVSAYDVYNTLPVLRPQRLLADSKPARWALRPHRPAPAYFFVFLCRARSASTPPWHLESASRC